MTIFRADGFEVVIYFNDHRPAHVHVLKAECEAIFNLNCPKGPPTVRENYGFSPTALNKIEDILTEKLQEFCERWRMIDGQA